MTRDLALLDIELVYLIHEAPPIVALAVLQRYTDEATRRAMHDSLRDHAAAKRVEDDEELGYLDAGDRACHLAQEAAL